MTGRAGRSPGIVLVPDRRLRLVSAPVAHAAETAALVAAMRGALAEAGGIGLAAPQVGVNLRVILVDADPEGDRGDCIALVNPVVAWSSPETSTRREGCLSIPGERWEVTRPAEVRVDYLDADGHARTWEAQGLVAACLQHEIDHLDGRLVIDGLSRVRRGMVERRVAKEASQAR